jgi:ankyrin repeat protein
MQKLIENGADINAATEAGDMAMHLAVLTGKVDLMKKLLGMGPKPDLYAVNRRGDTPLDTAWLWGFAAVGKLLEEEMEADGGEQKARERKNVEEEKKKAEGLDKMMGNSKKSREGAGLCGEEEWTSLSIADAGPNA